MFDWIENRLLSPEVLGNATLIIISLIIADVVIMILRQH